MSVREYIGARYVPLFVGEWDNTREYEPLCIVTYQGSSYTSRQFVPVGIAITNDSFWAETGNYSAQIEAYRQEVLTYDGRINTAQNTADNALSAVEKLTSAPSVYAYFKGYNTVIIGDSYAWGTGASDHGSGDTKRWSTLLCNWLESTEYNYAVGSTGFCDPGSGGQNAPFKTQVLDAASNMTAAQRRDTHLVVIAGGVNDYNEGSTYNYAAMQSGARDAAQNAYEHFPNALILIVPMLFKGKDVDPRLMNYESAIIDGVSGFYHVNNTRCIVGAWTWNFGKASRFANDGLHPNDYGHRNIAARMYANITGGTAYENALGFINFESGFSGAVAHGTYLEFMNGVVNSYGMQITIANGTSIDAGELKLIGSVSEDCVPLMNVDMIVTKGNAIVGLAIITTSGNLYIKNSSDTAFTDQILVGSCSYIPKGAY